VSDHTISDCFLFLLCCQGFFVVQRYPGAHRKDKTVVLPPQIDYNCHNHCAVRQIHALMLIWWCKASENLHQSETVSVCLKVKVYAWRAQTFIGCLKATQQLTMKLFSTKVSDHHRVTGHCTSKPVNVDYHYRKRLQQHVYRCVYWHMLTLNQNPYKSLNVWSPMKQKVQMQTQKDSGFS